MNGEVYLVKNWSESIPYYSLANIAWDGTPLESILVVDHINLFDEGPVSSQMAGANNAAGGNAATCIGPACAIRQIQIPPINVKKLVKWYLCGDSFFGNIRNYAIEGTTKGAIVGGVAGSEFGPPGIAAGAADGAMEGFILGTGGGWVASMVCQLAGAYGSQ